MEPHDVFWKLEALSDRQLLERVGVMLGSSRRLMAELIAHLGEVEERRLHLARACSSMFAYCLKLGMTEDEAYRRIEVARLARRYPAIFPLLAKGQLSISVVALLKHHLSEENHLELLAAVTGKSVAQTRELVASRFPRPDVPSSVRKLPERRTSVQPSLAMPTPTEPSSVGTELSFTSNAPGPNMGGTEASNASERSTVAMEPSAIATEPSFTSNVTEPNTGRTEPPTQTRWPAPPRRSSRIEPLSAQRYKVQLTASAELVRKLELARDLMRHTVPGGELGSIVERALDLLVEKLMKQRFGRIGKSRKARPKRTGERARHGGLEQPGDVTGYPSTLRDGDGARPSTHVAANYTAAQPGSAKSDVTNGATTTLDAAKREAAERDAVTLDAAPLDAAPLDAAPLDAAMLDAAKRDAAKRDAVTLDAEMLDAADVQGDGPAPERQPVSSYIPRSTRRTVVERDGLSCSWVDEHGTRCGSRSWLEYDHRCPRGKGGGAEPDNVRLLCRQHNLFAAEREYGRQHVAHTIAQRRQERSGGR